MKTYRQGDLFIQEVSEIPTGVKKILSGIVLLGESTGHSHRLVDGQVLTKGQAMFLQVNKKAQLVHEEHKTIDLPKGMYVVIRQREYVSADMVKVVVD